MDMCHQRCQVDVGVEVAVDSWISQSGVQWRGLGWREDLVSSVWKRFTIETRMTSLRQEGNQVGEL